MYRIKVICHVIATIQLYRISHLMVELVYIIVVGQNHRVLCCVLLNQHKDVLFCGGVA